MGSQSTNCTKLNCILHPHCPAKSPPTSVCGQSPPCLQRGSQPQATAPHPAPPVPVSSQPHQSPAWRYTRRGLFWTFESRLPSMAPAVKTLACCSPVCTSSLSQCTGLVVIRRGEVVLARQGGHEATLQSLPALPPSLLLTLSRELTHTALGTETSCLKLL